MPPATKQPKTVCPLTREQFREQAAPVVVTIAGTSHVAVPKEFSTGSLGWSVNGKAVIEVGGKPVTVQVGLNLTVVGSKELPR